jgi:HEAT repeat protein
VSERRHHDATSELLREAAAIDDWATDDRYWAIVDTVVHEPLDDVFAASQSLCSSDQASLRRLGAHLIAEMATRGLRRHAQMTEDAIDELLLLTSPDEDHDVLASAITASGRLGGRSLRRVVLGNVGHPAPQVRIAAAVALPDLTGGLDDPEVARALIVLTHDSHAVVRDFATYALAHETIADTSAVRDALLERLSDEDESTRGEALIGLARRRDPRTGQIVADALNSESSSMLTPAVLEAAIELADESFASGLITWRERVAHDDPRRELLERAIAGSGGVRSTPPERHHPTMRQSLARMGSRPLR